MTALLLLPILHAEPLRLSHDVVVLDNGLRLIVHEDHRAPLFAAELRYRVGAADDPVAGLAHLVEHLMFEGSASVPEGAYDRLLADVGASNNAWTAHDATAFTAVGPADGLELLLFLESDRMGFLTVDEEDLINQQAVVFSERAMSRSVVGGLETPTTSVALYPPAHPYRGTVLGEPEPLAAVTPEQVLAFVARWYQPANATLVIGGDVDTAEVVALAERHFSAVPAQTPPPQATAAPHALDAERRVALYDEVDPTLLAIWPTVPRLHPDEPALDLLADLLAERLGAEAWTSNRRLAGRLSVKLTQRRGPSRRLLRRLDRAVRALQRTPPTEAELARLTRRWRVGYVRSLEGLEARVAQLAACAMETETPDCVEDILQQREAVTPADIQRVATQYLGQGRLLVSEVPWRRRRQVLRGSEEVPL